MTRDIVFTASVTMLLLSFLAQLPAVAQSEKWLSDATDKVLDVYDGRSVLVIGELHGTVETPELVASLVTRLADEGHVTLALEVPRQEQQRIHTFLQSDGSRGALSNLFAGAFWQVPPDESDGRRSEAMVALLDAIRRARSQDKNVDVVTLDDVQFYAASSDRREGLAERITALARELDSGPVLVLLGNFHARVAPFTGTLLQNGESIKPPVPTASRVRDVPLTAMNVMARCGAGWSCKDGTCGPIELSGQCGEQEEVDALSGSVLRTGQRRRESWPLSSAR